MSSIVIHTLRESEQRRWTYGSNYVDGALRLFSVSSLLSCGDTRISLSEWRELDWKEKSEAFPRYVAISHSWTPSAEVTRISQNANRQLEIEIGQDSPHTISWHGLQQAALAAQHLKYELLWLDFICLNQTSASDKKLQVQQMGYLYEKAAAVIIMPGGVSAAQAIELEAPWITRAWTLQEATLCPKTYVLGLDGRPKITDEMHWSASSMSPGWFPPIDQVDGELGMTEIRDLFHSTYANIRITKFKKDTNEPIDTIQWTVNCLGRGPALSALGAILLAESPAMRQAGIWRSIWSRTSKYPQDMVFSIMHLLDVHLEVDYNRNMGDLIVELARKTSALPSWLDIGHDLPFSPQQGLIPMIPRHHPHQTPEYVIEGQHVDLKPHILTNDYISTFDIKILTPAVPSANGDLVCTEIYEVHCDAYGKPSVSNNLGETFTLSSLHVSTTHVMVVGYRNMIVRQNAAFGGPEAYQLRRSESGLWEKIGHCFVFNLNTGKAKRSHLQIGGSSGAEITPCDCLVK